MTLLYKVNVRELLENDLENWSMSVFVERNLESAFFFFSVVVKWILKHWGICVWFVLCSVQCRYETLAVATDADTRQDSDQQSKSSGKRLTVCILTTECAAVSSVCVSASRHDRVCVCVCPGWLDTGVRRRGSRYLCAQHISSDVLHLCAGGEKLVLSQG